MCRGGKGRGTLIHAHAFQDRDDDFDRLGHDEPRWPDFQIKRDEAKFPDGTRRFINGSARWLHVGHWKPAVSLRREEPCRRNSCSRQVVWPWLQEPCSRYRLRCRRHSNWCRNDRHRSTAAATSHPNSTRTLRLWVRPSPTISDAVGRRPPTTSRRW